jgi:hypothetical protein
VKTRAALTARCGETARRGLVAFLEYGSALEWLIGAGKRDPLAQAARRLGSPRQEAHRVAGDRNGSKCFDTPWAILATARSLKARGASTVRGAQ